MEKKDIIPYFKIARPDHSIKQLFIIPGCMAKMRTKICITHTKTIKKYMKVFLMRIYANMM